MQTTAVSERPPIDSYRTDDLRVDEVRVCEAFRHLTDKEAQDVIDALKTFTKIVYDHYKNQTGSL